MNALDALGNPTRRLVLDLIRDEPRAVHALHTALPEISRPAISRHLRILSEAGLVEAQPVGTSNVYRVRSEGFDDLRSYLESFYDDALPRYQMVAENLQ